MGNSERIEGEFSKFVGEIGIYSNESWHTGRAKTNRNESITWPCGCFILSTRTLLFLVNIKNHLGPLAVKL